MRGFGFKILGLCRGLGFTVSRLASSETQAPSLNSLQQFGVEGGGECTKIGSCREHATNTGSDGSFGLYLQGILLK